MTQIHVAIDKLPVSGSRWTAGAAAESGGGASRWERKYRCREGRDDGLRHDRGDLRSFSAKGINAGLNLNVPSGKYRLRTVVQESVDGKMASSTLNIEVK